MKKSLLIFSLSLGVAAKAQMSASAGSTQDLLIKKLTQVQLGLAPADPARSSVLLRLADLHSERARQLSMKEIADGCVVCKSGEKDRDKALAYYAEALSKVPGNLISKVYLQMGHLYELQGRSDLAEKNYLAMLGASTSALELAEANLSLAEMAFRKSDFKMAQELYTKVLATEGASSQGLAAYRKAWCAFRLSDMEAAVTQFQTILKTPRLQSRMASARSVADVQFLEEVSRDLATVMAARGIKESDPVSLYELTPENFRLQQVTLLAREGLRLGQKEASLKVWEFVFQKQSDPKARLEALVQSSQIQLDLKNPVAAFNSFRMVLELWGATDCNSASCADSAKGLRQFLVGWNRLENAKPSAELLVGYEEYLKVFNKDQDMYVWAAQVGVQLSKFSEAAQWTNQVNSLIVAEHSSSLDPVIKKALAEKLEKNLLTGIEMAEKSKDENLLISAQNEYLKNTILKQKSFDVLYQKAYSIYQKGDNSKAADLLNQLAMDEKGTHQIRLQAADLSLDALVTLKDDARIQKWSRVYSQTFLDKKAEFQGIHQKSILTQAANLAATLPDQALSVLSQFNVSEAGLEDKKTYFKNKTLLCEKLNRITEARVAVEDFLKQPTLNADEREFALGRKVWFAELELDFATALKTAEQMKFSTLSPDEKVLKLAMYSELAEVNPSNYYNLYLKQSKDEARKALIATQLIRLSNSPSKDLEGLKPYFKNSADLLARAALEVYQKNNDKKVLEIALKEKGAAKSDAFVMIEKVMMLSDLKVLAKQVAAHKFDTKNQKTIALGLKTRIKLLEKLDSFANRNIASGDWAGQLLSLHLVAQENLRFYNEALALPMPAGLTPEQENEYLTLLSQQVSPNQNAAQMAESKVTEFWGQKVTLASYEKFAAENSQWTALILEEMDALLAATPADQKKSWLATADTLRGQKNPVRKPSIAEFENARTHLKKNPFTAYAIQQVLDLEKQTQRKSMVEYLEGRLASLPKALNEMKEKSQ